MEQPEEWRTHPVLTKFLVSNLGNMKSNGKTIKGHKTAEGYVSLRQEKKKSIAAHIVIWEAFHGCYDHSTFAIHHKDHDAGNNVIDNLEKLSHGEHTALHNRRKSERWKQGNAIIAQQDGTTVLEFETLSAVAQHFGCSCNKVQSCLSTYKTLDGFSLHYVLDRSIEGEEWKPTDDFGPCDTFVSNYGRMKHKNRITFGTIDKRGYLHYGRWLVHQLVCRAFQGPPPDSSPVQANTVDHINRNKKDNNATNLRWTTAQIQAENKNATKAVEEYELDTNNVVGTWISAAAAERDTGIKNQMISFACCLCRIKDGGFSKMIGPRQNCFRFTGLTNLQKRRIRELYLFTDPHRLPNAIHEIKRHKGKQTYYMFVKSLNRRKNVYTKTFSDKSRTLDYNVQWHAAWLIQRYWRLRKAFPIHT